MIGSCIIPILMVFSSIKKSFEYFNLIQDKIFTKIIHLFLNLIFFMNIGLTKT